MMETFRERAQGRVNLIGEHTDYNGGWVLPTGIPQFTEVTLTKNLGNTISLRSSSGREYQYELGSEKQTGQWVDYLQGGTKILSELLRSGEQKLSGFTAVIESTIPEGSGVSSSAALEVSFLKAIRSAFSLDFTDKDLALLGQRIENEFVGARVGIMDQMAVSLAKTGEALFLDTKELTFERIPLPLDQMELIVVNSGLSHQISKTDGGYNQRRAECEEACKLLGISQLRDIDVSTLATKNLPEPLNRRARHVVTENGRVHLAVEAIKKSDLPLLGHLFHESHRSMKIDYEVSIPEIDLLVELCRNDSGCYGARLTGGGFGGSIIAITKKGQGAKISDRLIFEYKRKTGLKATVIV